jgi:hypothetical protein
MMMMIYRRWSYTVSLLTRRQEHASSKRMGPILAQSQTPPLTFIRAYPVIAIIVNVSRVRIESDRKVNSIEDGEYLSRSKTTLVSLTG